MAKYFVAPLCDAEVGEIISFGYDIVEAESEVEAIEVVVNKVVAWANDTDWFKMNGTPNDDVVTQQLSKLLTAGAEVAEAEAYYHGVLNGGYPGCKVELVPCRVLAHTLGNLMPQQH